MCPSFPQPYQAMVLYRSFLLPFDISLMDALRAYHALWGFFPESCSIETVVYEGKMKVNNPTHGSY